MENLELVWRDQPVPLETCQLIMLIDTPKYRFLIFKNHILSKEPEIFLFETDLNFSHACLWGKLGLSVDFTKNDFIKNDFFSPREKYTAYVKACMQFSDNSSH